MKQLFDRNDALIRGLEASSRFSEETGYPGQGIKPCIATLLEAPLTKGDFPNRNAASVAVACELKRIGQTYDQTLQRLVQWNDCHSPPLRYTDLERAVASAFTRDYKYGCRHNILQAYCGDENLCPFANDNRSKPKKFNDLKFVDYDWPKYLTNSQTIIYAVALPHLEKTRRIGGGGRIYANHQQIAKAGGISDRRIGDHLRQVAAAGLIEYVPGKPLKWEGMASEIRRVFPIPRPTLSVIKLLKNNKLNKQNKSEGKRE